MRTDERGQIYDTPIRERGVSIEVRLSQASEDGLAKSIEEESPLARLAYFREGEGGERWCILIGRDRLGRTPDACVSIGARVIFRKIVRPGARDHGSPAGLIQGISRSPAIMRRSPHYSRSCAHCANPSRPPIAV